MGEVVSAPFQAAPTTASYRGRPHGQRPARVTCLHSVSMGTEATSANVTILPRSERDLSLAVGANRISR